MTILTNLLDHPVILGDGAMGTYVVDKIADSPPEPLIELACLKDPRLIEEVHLEYIKAGSILIETNSFASNSLSLDGYGMAGEWTALNEAAGLIARRAADQVPGTRVAGAIGPWPLGYTLEHGATAVRDQAAVLAGAGCDVILLESFNDPTMLTAACSAIRQVWTGPLIAQLSADSRGGTSRNVNIGALIKLVHEGLAEIVGFNCGQGTSGLLEMVRDLASRTPAPVSVFPNASLPAVSGGRVVYGAHPRFFATVALELVTAGARLLGGCCGTRPEHIAAVKAALESVSCRPHEPAEDHRAQPRAAVVATPNAPAPPPAPRRPKRKPFSIIVELSPPKTHRVGKLLERARALAEAGAEAFSMTENPLAMPRMGNAAAAHLVQEATGLPCILHVTCRDRNLIGQRSHLLGAHALGLRNVLLLTGDPCRGNGTPKVSSVFDTNSFGLVQLTSELANGLDGAAGAPLFHIGCALNANAGDLASEVRRLQRKVSLGAVFAQTQPIFSPELLESVHLLTEGLSADVYPGVLPLRSYRNAFFLHNEFPGIKIPDEVLRDLADRDDMGGMERGLQMAEEMVSKAMQTFTRVYIIAPSVPLEGVLRLVRRAKESIAG